MFARSARFLVVGALFVLCIIELQLASGEEYPDEYDDPYPRYGKKGGLIDVDVRDTDHGTKHVGVHVPIFYKMDLDKDKYDGRKGLGISVLEGLVKVRVKKDPYKFKDNVFVSVAGVPMWMQ